MVPLDHWPMRDKQKQNFDFTVKWFDSRERNLG